LFRFYNFSLLTSSESYLFSNKPVPRKNIVYAHGSLRWAQCMKCRAKVDSSEIIKDVQGGRVPLCKAASKTRKRPLSSSNSVCISKTDGSECSHAVPSSVTRLRRSNSVFSSCSSISDTQSCVISSSNGMPEVGLCNGIMKPGITFFGEKLHYDVNRLLEADRKKADALIVMGTSLSV